MKHVLLATTLLVTAGLSSSASVPRAGQEPSFRSTTSELVVLPVAVADGSGRLVSDLPMDRFSVLDNNRKQPITFFSNEDIPVTIGLVLDNSSSMRPKLGEVVAASLALARTSNPHDELFLLEFNDRVNDPLEADKFVRARDLKTLEAGLMSLKPEGRTALYDALMVALDRLDRVGRSRKFLVIMSDGGDNASQVELKDVLARARRSDATLYTIGLFDPEDPDTNPRVLKALAHETGGERFLPKSPGVLVQVCEHIAREVRSGYTIGYVPPDRDGTFHRVQVQVDAPEHRRLVVRTRPGYFAARQGQP